MKIFLITLFVILYFSYAESRRCYDAAKNRYYKRQETFTHVDGCNTCTCYNGKISCTKKACPPIEPRGCYYAAKHRYYKHKETFTHVDGCNTCMCYNGKISCTKKDCPPIRCGCFDVTTKRCVRPGQAFYDGCNTCLCSNGGPTICTKRYCSEIEPVKEYI